MAVLGASRLLPLTGPGAARKTSLALEAAQATALSYRDGIWFIGLAGVTDPARVPLTIAEALGGAGPP